MYYLVTHKENCKYNKNLLLFKSKGIRIVKTIKELETSIVNIDGVKKLNALKSFDFVHDIKSMTDEEFKNFSVY